VPIAGAYLPWKPDKPYGKVYARATVELQTSNGNTIGTPAIEVVGMEIY
jgi:hypothetical protein